MIFPSQGRRPPTNRLNSWRKRCRKDIEMKTFCVAVLLVVLPLAVAQAQTTSVLSGVVTDPSGASVPGAIIQLVNSQTGAQRTVTTDSQGRYSFTQMQPGTYKVTARAAGFSEVVIGDIGLLVNT